MVDGMSRAWSEMVGNRLKALVETGTRTGIDSGTSAEVRVIGTQKSRSSGGEKRRKSP
jgi:hypothetical protein